MRSCGILVAEVFALLAGIGCGTFYNIESVHRTPLPCADSYRIYGGVQHDMEQLALKTKDTFCGEDPLHRRVVAFPFVLGIYALDLPLSFVGDTLTLPVTIKAAAEGWNDGPVVQRPITEPKQQTGSPPPVEAPPAPQVLNITYPQKQR